MGLRTILDKMYNTRPFLAIRKELNRKIDKKIHRVIEPLLDNKLNEVVQPLNSALGGIKDQLHDTRHFLDGRHFDLVRLLHRTIDEHAAIVRNQSYTMYPGLQAALYPAFLQILKKISGEDHQDLLGCAHLLLLEIARQYHMIPGGIWQLDHEINLFNAPPPALLERSVPPADAPVVGRLKILVVSGMFPCVEHGGGLRLFDIVDQLAGEHEIDLFSIYMPELDQQSLARLEGKLGEVKLLDEVDFTSANLLDWLNGLGRAAGHYHVIQCEYPLSARLIPTARPYGRKIGFTFMECVTKSYLIKLRNSIADNDFTHLGQQALSFWEFAVAEMAAARTTDFQIAMTPEDAANITRISGVQPAIVPTCLSPSEVISRVEACRGAAPEGDTVTFLGYFNHFPNIDGVKWYLANVHQAVKRQVPGYRFLVVGAGDTSALQKISGADPSVVYTGRVDDITPHILRGKVCVLPLISGAGIRGKLNQYSIAGRPSVTTTIGNLGLNYQDGQTVLVADSPEDFALAIVRLLTDAELNRTIAAQAQAFAQANFTWERHLARLLEIYRA